MATSIQLLSTIATLKSQVAHSWEMVDSWEAEGDFDTADMHADTARRSAAMVKALSKRGGRADRVDLNP